MIFNTLVTILIIIFIISVITLSLSTYGLGKEENNKDGPAYQSAYFFTMISICSICVSLFILLYLVNSQVMWENSEQIENTQIKNQSQQLPEQQNDIKKQSIIDKINEFLKNAKTKANTIGEKVKLKLEELLGPEAAKEIVEQLQTEQPNTNLSKSNSLEDIIDEIKQSNQETIDPGQLKTSNSLIDLIEQAVPEAKQIEQAVPETFIPLTSETQLKENLTETLKNLLEQYNSKRSLTKKPVVTRPAWNKSTKITS